MRCHYEVLELARDADGDAVRKAYRRLALVWHPDKCREPGADERFKEIQQAYETLSDATERAWCARAQPHAQPAAARTPTRA